MRFKWTGKRFEWFKSTLDMWGTIAPPAANRFATPADVYLDLGAPDRCIRNIYVENLLDCTGTAFNLSGVVGSVGATSFSGLIDTSGVYTSGKLTRFDGSFWQPYDEILSHPGLSGLVDVQSAPWASGNLVGWNGVQYVPTTNASPFSNVSGHFISQFSATDSIQLVHSLGSYPQVTVLDSIFCEQDVQVCHDDVDTTTLTFNGTISGWFIADIGLAGLAGIDGADGAAGAPGAPGADGTLALSGLTEDTTIVVPQLVSGHLLSYDGATWRSASRFFQPSGFQVPSGDYATVSQGHELWAQSGLWKSEDDFFQPSGYQVPSGDYATVSQGHQLFAQSGYLVPSGHTLETHGDVVRDSPLVSGHTIGYNGTNWVNTTPGAGGGNDTLTITSSGEILVKRMIHEEVLGAAGTFAVSGLNDGFDWIEFRFDGLRAEATTASFVGLIHFNGDATNSNYWHASHTYGNVTQGDEAEGPFLGLIASTDETAGYASFLQGTIYNGSDTTYHTTVQSKGGVRVATTTAQSRQYDFQWDDTSVITDMRFSINNAEDRFKAGTKLMVWGVQSQWVVQSGTLGDATIVNGMIVP